MLVWGGGGEVILMSDMMSRALDDCSFSFGIL